MRTNRLSPLLRVNAVYSVASGVIAIGARSFVASALELPASVVVLLGVGLIGFGLLVGLFSIGERATPRAGFAIAAGDAAWVLMVGLYMVVVRPSGTGLAIAALSSVPVALLAVLQGRASNRLVAPARRVVEVSQVIDGDRAAVWEVMTDPQVYARLSPNLSKVGAFSVAGTGGQRRCWDLRGKGWDESLTLWRPGDSFSVDVHTDADDYPYPIAQMRGTWSVADAGPGRSRVTMTFEFQPRSSVAGRAFAAALAGAGQAMIGRIISGWESEVAARSADRAGLRGQG